MVKELKTPLRTEAIVIVAKKAPFGRDGYEATSEQMLKAVSHSTGSALSAASNLAKRWFWGGVTYAFTGRDDRIQLARIGNGKGSQTFRATLREGAV